MFIIEHDYYVEQLIERPRFIKKDIWLNVFSDNGLLCSWRRIVCNSDGRFPD